ncbi:hypothetical protein BST61_g10733 [Cercospora zeina]
MLMNSYIAAAVLAFGAAQTGARPIAVPPRELLAENNIPLHGVDPSKWSPSYAMEKREAEAQWGSANADGSVPSSFMQAVNKWQQNKGGNKNNNNKWPPIFWRRDASVAADTDGSLPPHSIEALGRRESLNGLPGEKRDAVPFSVWPELSQRTDKKWKARLGHPVKERRAADREHHVPKNPIFLAPMNDKRAADKEPDDARQPIFYTTKNEEPRPLMIQRREAEAEAEAEAQVFSSLPPASYFKNWQAAISKDIHETGGKNDKRQWTGGSPIGPPPTNSYISIPASFWASAMEQQQSSKGNGGTLASHH